MMSILRSILSVIAGFITTTILITFCELGSHVIYPPPPDIDPTNLESLKAVIAQMPTGAFVLLAVGWAIGSVGGAAVTAWIAGKSKTLHAMVLGGILTAGSVVNMTVIPHPLWFWPLGAGIFFPMVYIGARLAQMRETA